jgi:hypothetical protein
MKQWHCRDESETYVLAVATAKGKGCRHHRQWHARRIGRHDQWIHNGSLEIMQSKQGQEPLIGQRQVRAEIVVSVVVPTQTTPN